MIIQSPLRSFCKRLEEKKLLTIIDKTVDPYLEIAEIQRKIQAVDGPALLFRNVKNSDFPVVTGLFGTLERVHLAFDQKPELWIQEMIDFMTHPNFSFKNLWQKRRLFQPFFHLGKKKGFFKGVLKKQLKVDLNQLPLLQLWPEDGGHFLTLPLVYTQFANSENLGIYRMQRFNQNTLGLHFQIGKGGGFHYFEAEKQNLNLPVTVYLGGPPEWILSALAPLPENVSELLFASCLLRKKLRYKKVKDHPHDILLDAEFVLTGHAKPRIREMEGPFGDHFGYYSLKHPFPTFHCEAIYHREKPIFPAMVVGKPNQEDAYLGNYLQKLLKPLIKLVMPQIVDLWSYSECGFHNLASAIVKQRYHLEALQAAFRILGEGQLSLTKCLLIIDGQIDLTNFSLTLTYLLERLDPSSIYLFRKTSADTLDYSAQTLNEGSKVIFMGIGDSRRKYSHLLPPLPKGVTKARLFCPGCLCVETKSDFPIQKLSLIPDIALCILVDNIDLALKNDTCFLWTVFTQLNPATDIYLERKLPFIIDGRKKSYYPKEVLSSPKVAKKVEKHWEQYFENSEPMGDANQAHVY